MKNERFIHLQDGFIDALVKIIKYLISLELDSLLID